MPPQSLKITYPFTADDLEGAIAELGDRFLQAGKSSAKVGVGTGELSLAQFCKGLIEDWKSGKTPYSKGEIILSFTSGKVSGEADLLVYKSQVGDRFLYAKQSTTVQPNLPGFGTDPLVAQSLQTLTEVLTELTAHQRSLESRMQSLMHFSSDPSPEPLVNQFTQQLRQALDAQATLFAQNLASQITATALHFSERLDALQGQLNQLSERMKALEALTEPELAPQPQTEADWLHRIQETWGTVGDYEQFSLNYRATHAETPLFYTPDWIALCELDWAQKLCPTLAALREVIHGEQGIGYGGSDILQQFGCHVDPTTGDRYHIYRLRQFSAYDALWRTVSNSERSWLPELKQLLRAASRHRDIFELFGWEAEAIASLKSIVDRASYDRPPGQDRKSTQGGWQAPPQATTLNDYLAILNINPFTPITLESIKRAYKQAMKVAHPDTGGSKEQAQMINEAYEAVLQHYFPQAT